jgi:2,3-bisphosphoglycerate-independent phosphoglycerate mutase
MNDLNKRPLALILLDGWGASQANDGNAIAMAHTPCYDEICQKYPMTTLTAAESAEAGHLNITAGRTVVTEAVRINSAIASGEFFESKELREAFSTAARDGKAVHLAGLLSGSERHASSETLYSLLKMAKDHGVKDVFIHGFLDGRDTPPQTAEICIEALERQIAEIGIGRIASLCGRFFAMDTDGNWERTARAFTLMVYGEGEHAPDAKSAIEKSSMSGISEEFMAPVIIGDGGKLGEGDTLVFFNHRADGMRQLVRSFAGAGSNVRAVCMTEYDKDFGLPVVFSDDKGSSLSDILALANVSQVRISQAECLHSGDELGSFVPNGANVIFRSRAGMSAADEPEMSSFKIANELMQKLEDQKGDFFVVTLPAADVIASAQNMQGTIEAIQYIDTCLGGIVDKVLDADGTVIITSPNSNLDDIKQQSPLESGASPTPRIVPFHLIEKAGNLTLRDGGSLSDVAPTILSIFGLAKPPEMSGNDLRSSR